MRQVVQDEGTAALALGAVRLVLGLPPHVRIGIVLDSDAVAPASLAFFSEIQIERLHEMVAAEKACNDEVNEQALKVIAAAMTGQSNG